MQFLRFSALAGALVCVTTSDLFASERLTPSGLVANVLSSNPQLVAANATRDAASERVVISGRLADPNLMIGLAPNTVNDEVGSRTSLKLSQKLSWPGKLGLERELAEAGANHARQATDSVVRNVVLQANTAWAEWWYVH